MVCIMNRNYKCISREIFMYIDGGRSNPFINSLRPHIKNIECINLDTDLLPLGLKHALRGIEYDPYCEK